MFPYCVYSLKYFGDEYKVRGPRFGESVGSFKSHSKSLTMSGIMN